MLSAGPAVKRCGSPFTLPVLPSMETDQTSRLTFNPANAMRLPVASAEAFWSLPDPIANGVVDPVVSPLEEICVVAIPLRWL